MNIALRGHQTCETIQSTLGIDVRRVVPHCRRRIECTLQSQAEIHRRLVTVLRRDARIQTCRVQIVEGFEKQITQGLTEARRHPLRHCRSHRTRIRHLIQRPHGERLIDMPHIVLNWVRDIRAGLREIHRRLASVAMHGHQGTHELQHHRIAAENPMPTAVFKAIGFIDVLTGGGAWR